MEERGSLMKSGETSGGVSNPRMPLSGPSAAVAKRALTSSTVVARSTSNTQSVSEAFSSGTRTAWPFSRPSSSG